MDVTEDKTNTLRAESNHPPIALDYHPADSRIGIKDEDNMQTLTSRMGTGGNNVPLVMNSSGEGIAGTIDANYYKGAGQREGIEREYVAVAIDTSHADDVVRVTDTVGTLQERDYKGGKLVAYKESSFGGFSEGVGTLKAKSGVAGGGSETLIVTDEGTMMYDAYQHHGYRESKTVGTLTRDQNVSIRGDTPLVADLVTE